MGRRFSRIKQGALYQEGLTNYINYLNTAATRPRRIGQMGARGTTLTVYLTPFMADIATDELAAARVNPTHYSQLSTYINAGGTGAQVANTLGANNIVQIPKFRAARIVFFTNATRSVQVTTSDITGLQYLKYNGERSSCPFGRNLETDNQMDAFQQIKAGILAGFAGNEIKRVSLQREVMSSEAA